MTHKLIVVNDVFQKNYRYYLTEQEGKNFDPQFKPDLTPHEMIKLGVFGGEYVYPHIDELPKNWLITSKISQFYDTQINFFKVKASQPLSIWQKKGWIYHDDPHGWFEWYWRYYRGRRLPHEDNRQIKRWKSIRRHIAQLQKYCRRGDLSCRPTQRQALLHWAYDSRKL